MNDSFFDHRSEASGRYDYPKEIAFDHASMLRELWIVFETIPESIGETTVHRRCRTLHTNLATRAVAPGQPS